MSRYRCRPIWHVIHTCAKSSVMEFVHCDFRKFQNTEAQIDGSVDDYFRFLLSNRYEIVTGNVPMECGGFRYGFLCTSRIGNQFEVHSFTETFYFYWFLLCACKYDDFAARLFAVLKPMHGFIQALCLNFKFDGLWLAGARALGKVLRFHSVRRTWFYRRGLRLLFGSHVFNGQGRGVGR